MTWLDRARVYVDQVTLGLPDSAPLTERRKLLREVGHRFHGGTFWGRRKYGRACREYLARHGGKEAAQLIRADHRDRLSARAASGDIVFPFREPLP